MELSMEEKKMFATRINKDLLKKLKILSVHQEKPINSLLEEAIQDLLKKHNKSLKVSKLD
jgi:predicted HicB family RNase H-like nuclease